MVNNTARFYRFFSGWDIHLGLNISNNNIDKIAFCAKHNFFWKERPTEARVVLNYQPDIPFSSVPPSLQKCNLNLPQRTLGSPSSCSIGQAFPAIYHGADLPFKNLHQGTNPFIFLDAKIICRKFRRKLDSFIESSPFPTLSIFLVLALPLFMSMPLYVSLSLCFYLQFCFCLANRNWFYRSSGLVSVFSLLNRHFSRFKYKASSVLPQMME